MSLGSGELDSERDEPEPEGRRRRPLSVAPPGVLGVLSPPVAVPPAPLAPLAYHRWCGVVLQQIQPYVYNYPFSNSIDR